MLLALYALKSLILQIYISNLAHVVISFAGFVGTI